MKKQIQDLIYKAKLSPSDYADIIDTIYSAMKNDQFIDPPNQAQHDALKMLLIARDKVRVFFGPVIVGAD